MSSLGVLLTVFLLSLLIPLIAQAVVSGTQRDHTANPTFVAVLSIYIHIYIVNFKLFDPLMPAIPWL